MATALSLATNKGRRAALNAAHATYGQMLGDIQSMAEAVEELIVADLAELGGDTGGIYTNLDRVLRADHRGGKSAWIDAIKGTPTIAESAAADAWAAAASATSILGISVYFGSEVPIVPAAHYYGRMASYLVAHGSIASTSWTDLRAWVISADKTTIMALEP